MTIEQVFAEVLNVPAQNISDETSPKTVSSWDSLRHVELIMAVERAFNVAFSMPEISTINSLGVVRQLLQQKGVPA
jgi:acyl carrier protein